FLWPEESYLILKPRLKKISPNIKPSLLTSCHSPNEWLLFLLDLCYPGGKGLHKPSKEFLCRLIGEVAAVIKQLGGSPDIGFRLCHRGYIDKNQGLTQMVVGAKATNIANRNTNHRGRLAIPGILPIRARAYIDGILQHPRYGTVVLRRKKEQTIHSPYFFPEVHPFIWWRVFQVFVEHGELADLQKLKRQ